VSVHKYETKAGQTRYRVIFRDADGRQRSRTVKTLNEARRLDANVKTLPPKSVADEAVGLSVGAWIVSWFDTYSREWAITTVKQRKSIADRWIFPLVGDWSMVDLTSRRVREYRNLMLEHGATNTTVNQAIRMLSAALSAAVENDLIDHNPCLGIRRLPQRASTRRALTPAEVERIRAEMPTPRDKIIVSILAYAGLRPAELCGLEWDDITDQRILVERSAQFGEIVNTKTKRSRIIALSDVLRDDLAEYRATTTGEGLVVRGSRGSILHWKNWFRRVWKPAALRAGVEATPYELRHTYASLLLHAGTSIPAAAAALGHANPTLTLNTYAHVYADAQLTPHQPMGDAIVAARTAQAATRPRALRAV
jgi:integrase